MISPADLSLYKVTDSVDEAVAEVVELLPRLPQHALRQGRPGAAAAEAAAARRCWSGSATSSRDIVAAGTFEQTAALPAEANDPHLADLPRLRFRFDRRSLGRLRQLIDVINRDR